MACVQGRWWWWWRKRGERCAWRGCMVVVVVEAGGSACRHEILSKSFLLVSARLGDGVQATHPPRAWCTSRG